LLDEPVDVGCEVLRLLAGCLLLGLSDKRGEVNTFRASDMLDQAARVVNRHSREGHHLALRLNNGAGFVDQELPVCVDQLADRSNFRAVLFKLGVVLGEGFLHRLRQALPVLLG
ncbi:MAG: hypothetical protein JHC46_05660, partial [Solirubrobacteraceae bacterium]|nr:hypothetical protein [Solirubrobacteraceae bacterium]